MKNGKSTCPLTDEIVSYMYGEIGGKVESDFEMHLAACTACTDEFAAVADSRFSVFEWKKEAFDPLPTPLFDVPYQRETHANEIGFAAVVKAWAQRFSIPVAVAAVLALFAGVGVIMFETASEPSVSVRNVRPVVQPESEPESPAPALVAPEPPEPRDVVQVKRPSRPAANPVRVSIVRPKTTDRSRVIVSEKKPSKDLNSVPQSQKAPALTAYQENDDESLRLAELFDEVGG